MLQKRLLILATLLLMAAMMCIAVEKDTYDDDEYYDYDDYYEDGSGDQNKNEKQDSTVKTPANHNDLTINNDKANQVNDEKTENSSPAAPISNTLAPAYNSGTDIKNDNYDDYDDDDYNDKDFYADKPLEPANPNAPTDVILPADLSSVQQVSYQTTSSKLLAIVSKPGILAGIVGGAIIGILTAVLLIMFIVYRMRKKDEGSYALEETKKPLSAYDYRHCPTKEFYA